MNQDQKSLAFWITVLISIAALVVSTIISIISFRDNQKTQTMNLKTAIFSEFQQEYSDISGRFPSKYLEPTFRPARGSEEYGRLEAYWYFCFAEWYATKRINPHDYGSLWDRYYSPLIEDALNIPSLHYVLEDMIGNYRIDRGEWRPFFGEMSRLAVEAHAPLDVHTVAILVSRADQERGTLPPPGMAQVKRASVGPPPTTGGG